MIPTNRMKQYMNSDTGANDLRATIVDLAALAETHIQYLNELCDKYRPLTASKPMLDRYAACCQARDSLRATLAKAKAILYEMKQ